MNTLPEYWLYLKRVVASGDVVKLSAKDNQLSAINDILPFEKLQSFEAELKAGPWGSNGMVVTGIVKASGEQICVASLEPMTSNVETQFERTFVPEASSSKFNPDIIDGEMVLDPEEDDYPDTIEGDRINAWEILIEELNLAIDPYPRSDKAVNVVEETQPEPSDEPTHRPFAGLDTLIIQKKSGN